MKMKTKNMLAREKRLPQLWRQFVRQSDYRIFNGLGLRYCGLTHPIGPRVGQITQLDLRRGALISRVMRRGCGVMRIRVWLLIGLRIGPVKLLIARALGLRLI